MYVYMSHGYTAKMSIIACLEFLKINAKKPKYIVHVACFIKLNTVHVHVGGLLHFPPN